MHLQLQLLHLHLLHVHLVLNMIGRIKIDLKVWVDVGIVKVRMIRIRIKRSRKIGTEIIGSQISTIVRKIRIRDGSGIAQIRASNSHHVRLRLCGLLLRLFVILRYEHIKSLLKQMF